MAAGDFRGLSLLAMVRVCTPMDGGNCGVLTSIEGRSEGGKQKNPQHHPYYTNGYGVGHCCWCGGICLPAWRAGGCIFLVAVCDVDFCYLNRGCLVVSVDVDGRWRLLVDCWLVDLNGNLNTRILVVSADDVDNLIVSRWLAVSGCMNWGECWRGSLTI